VFRLRKRLASSLILLFSRGLKPHRIFIRDKRLERLEEIFKQAIGKETDPLMRARWNALCKTVMWLCSNDGAYRTRLIWLLNEIGKNKKEWKYKPWEARF
jgi:hypothetical protein